MKITVSVPGKIHLMGEHAVVYGKPALLAAINLRLWVTLETGKKGVEIISDEPTNYIKHALSVVQKHYRLSSLPGLKITIKSDIPAGYHLGSSAAVAVGTIGALIYYLKKTWDLKLINELAYETEKKQHGNPSGGDNTAVTFGGFLWFRKELESLKIMQPLQLQLTNKINHFYLIDTGRPVESTGEMVGMVKEKVKKQKTIMQKLFDQNEEQVRVIALALQDGNENNLIRGLQLGQQTLEAMGVVSQKVKPLVRAIEQSGGAAKILGGGGKKAGVGFLLCYHRDRDKVERLCQPYGFALQQIKLGAEGLRLEQK